MKEHEIAACISTVADIATQYHNHQSLRERIAQVLRPALSVGTFDPADMATAAAQGFRDGQAAEHPDTARLRFMFDCVQKDSDPYTDEVTARVEKEFTTQADIKTFDHFRRVVDIARGAV